MEGLSRERQNRCFPGEMRQRLLFGYGMISDDTEHTLMVAQALLAESGSVDRFQRRLARILRWWLAALPAGIGMATLRAIMKLWLGVSPSRSGVWSAGNGPAMRSAIVGIFFSNDPASRASFVTASARITHTDPRATVAALAVAEAAVWMVAPANPATEVGLLFGNLRALSDDNEWSSLILQLQQAWEGDLSVSDFAIAIGAGAGVSGYAYRTVPVALYAALKHRDDFAAAITAAIRCGGDTDTVGAIVGALVGARTGPDGIPQEWIRRLRDWPISVALLRRIAVRLHAASESGSRSHAVPIGPVVWWWVLLPLRNAFFLLVVLFHGFRRLLPF